MDSIVSGTVENMDEIGKKKMGERNIGNFPFYTAILNSAQACACKNKLLHKMFFWKD